MNRREFLKTLRRELESLPFDEREEALAYYEEYLDEAGPEREEDAIRSFGSPREIAARILADHAIKTPPKTPKEGFSKIWLIVLAIFSAPLALPLAIALGAMVFSMFIAVISVVFSIGLVALVLILGGGATIVASFFSILTGPGTFFFLLGSGMVMVGLGILLAYLTYIVAIKLPAMFIRFLSRFIRDRRANA